ncbi:MAG TPA: dTDP-4-dehydrorhamnose 3,5-epimerase [Bacteroidales bacterium]|nr:dTDP-4-dehydrorhamnose 3,5-epimerase [Bacteroidales bacterium]
MNIEQTILPGLKIIEPRIFADDRGYFFESYNQQKFSDQGIDITFVQDNQSKSSYGVIRGLHYQLNPKAQTKLVRVLQGTIFDVAVDIRKGSPTFLQWFGIELSEENKKQLLIPQGFAHGFSVLSETAVVMYKCDNLYAPELERGIIYNDADLKIDWQIEPTKAIVSGKDKQNPVANEAETNFSF